MPIRKAGRPIKYSDPRHKALIEALRAGMTRGAACSHAGISYQTLYRWVRDYPKFAQEVDAAENSAESRFTAVVAKAAVGHMVKKTKTTIRKDGETETTTEEYFEYDWRAALEWLKRRKRKEWGDNVHVDLDREIAGLLAELAGGGQESITGEAES